MHTGPQNKSTNHAAARDTAVAQPKQVTARSSMLSLLQRAEQAPHTLTPADAARLQTALGNRSMGALAFAVSAHAGQTVQRVNGPKSKSKRKKGVKKHGKKKWTKHSVHMPYKAGKHTFLRSRGKDIVAGGLAPIFVKNKAKPSVVRIRVLAQKQDKLFQRLDVTSLQLSVRRELNSALDEIQAQIKSSIKEMTKDDPTFAELTAWRDKNPNDPLAMQLSSLMHNMFAEKPHSVPQGVDIANTYHTGQQNDPIPIVWYKPENAYKPITPMSAASGLPSIPFSGGGMIGGLNFGLAPGNLPSNWTKANPIKKVFHESDRGNQKGYNAHLRKHGYCIGDDYNLDGDHVMDLGFNGQDVLNNYWPLKSEVNRRAFHGYNESYVLNYYVMEMGVPVPKAKSIGGLVNRYFYVKDYLKTGSVPAESGKAKAGTDQV